MKFEAAILFIGYAVGSAYAATKEGDDCRSIEGKGKYLPKDKCKGISYRSVHADNSPDVQCCVEVRCKQGDCVGYCRSKSMNGCSDGSFVPHFAKPWRCPGTNDIQCCIPGAPPGPNSSDGQNSTDGQPGNPQGGPQDPPQEQPEDFPQDPSQGEPQGGFEEVKDDDDNDDDDKDDDDDDDKDDDEKDDDKKDDDKKKDDKKNDDKKKKKKKKKDIGKAILKKAQTAKGKPYAWGGGSCKGPTGDIAPHDYGRVGYDCSGLVAWAVCQVTGRNLFKEGLRVTSSMYCASEKKLKYKKYKYSERKAGDAVFFGGSCDCKNNPSSISHVGLMMNSKDRMFNAPTPGKNIQEASVSGFSKKPCPSVIRFTD